jgi:hypothetical protein
MIIVAILFQLVFNVKSYATDVRRPSTPADVEALLDRVRPTSPEKEVDSQAAQGRKITRGMIFASALQESQAPSGNDFGSAYWYLARPEPDTKLGPEYLRLLKDESEPIRGAAASALGILNEKGSAPEIRKLLKNLPMTSLDADPPSFDSPPQETQHENAYAMTYATALMRLEDCKSVPAILERKSISFSWSTLLKPCTEAAKPLLLQMARQNTSSKNNVPMTIRVLYGKEVLDSVQPQKGTGPTP